MTQHMHVSFRLGWAHRVFFNKEGTGATWMIGAFFFNSKHKMHVCFDITLDVLSLHKPERILRSSDKALLDVPMTNLVTHGNAVVECTGDTLG